MSFIQLVSPDNSPAKFNVNFSETLELTSKSKIALINFSGSASFSINVLDLNEDTNVDVFDIIILVNLVLGA